MEVFCFGALGCFRVGSHSQGGIDTRTSGRPATLSRGHGILSWSCARDDPDHGGKVSRLGVIMYRNRTFRLIEL